MQGNIILERIFKSKISANLQGNILFLQSIACYRCPKKSIAPWYVNNAGHIGHAKKVAEPGQIESHQINNFLRTNIYVQLLMAGQDFQNNNTRQFFYYRQINNTFRFTCEVQNK